MTSSKKALGTIIVLLTLFLSSVQLTAQGCTLSCIADINLSLSTECEGFLDIDDVFIASPGCTSEFTLTITDMDGNPVPNPIPSSYVGIPLTYQVTESGSGNFCWGNIHLENKFPFACLANVVYNIGPSCEAEVTVQQLLSEGLCPDSFDLTIIDADGNAVPNPIPASYGGQTLTAIVTERSSGNSCFSALTINYSAGALVCLADVNVSLGGSCDALVEVGDLMVSGFCPGTLVLTLMDGDGNPVPNPIPASYTGVPITYIITEVTSGNSCFGNIHLENKFFFACLASLEIEIDASCESEVTVSDILSPGMCPESFDLEIKDQFGDPVPNPIPASYSGQTLFAAITERSSGASCFTELHISYDPGPLVCLADVNVSLDGSSCDALVTVDDLFISGTCSSVASLILLDGDGNPVPNPIPASYTGTTITYQIFDALTGNSCFGNIHLENKFSFSCIINLNLSMDTDCEAELTVADLFSHGLCPESFDLNIVDASSNPVSNPIPGSYIGQTLTATITERSSGTSCSSTITLEDKIPPVIIGAVDTTMSLKDYEDGISYVTAVDECPGVVTLTCTETYSPVTCDPYTFIVHKEWTATDAFGNASVANHDILIESNKTPSCKISGQKDCSNPFTVTVEVKDMGPVASYSWSVDNGWSIVGAGASATVTSAGGKGEVTVVVTDVNGCTTTCSKKYSCPKNKSFDSMLTPIAFNISPNPANDRVLIDGIQVGNTIEVIRIFDVTGSMHYEQEFILPGEKTTISLDINFLENGVYVVVIGGQSRKMIINR